MRTQAILLTLFSVLVLVSSATWAAKTEVTHLTLSDMEETYSLEVLWQFLPGDDLGWGAPAYDDRGWQKKRIPEVWPKGGYPESGQFAWYRLSLSFDPQQRDELSHIGVRMGKVLSAYEFYAGGELLGGVGKLPPLGEVNYGRTRLYAIPPSAIADDGTLVLALRVWGGSDLAAAKWGGGPREEAFQIGSYARLLQGSFISDISRLNMCVLLLAFGCYHLYLYHRNRQLKAYLWYGLAALDVSIYSLMSTQWRYSLDWSFIIYEKIEFGSIYFFPALVIQMIWSLLGLRIGRALRVYQASFIVIAVAVVLVPGMDAQYYTLHPWQVWSLGLLVAILWVIVREARSGNAEARTALVGVSIFLAACVNDLMIDLAGWNTVRLVLLGFMAIMLSMAVSLANRFTAVLSDLEGQVVQRTTDLRSANKQLAEIARRDPLTGILNRRGFSEEAQSGIQCFKRNGNTPSLVLADLDNFKAFNDEFGHACGDSVLQQVACLLGEHVRIIDKIARWGGEEFILMLPETSPDGACQVAEKLRTLIESKAFEYEGQQLGVTMTFGVATFRKGEALKQCIARADSALYKGKEQGRNQVVVAAATNLTLINTADTLG